MCLCRVFLVCACCRFCLLLCFYVFLKKNSFFVKVGLGAGLCVCVVLSLIVVRCVSFVVCVPLFFLKHLLCVCAFWLVHFALCLPLV